MTDDVTEVRSMLAEACERWQLGRDGGSSLLRGAARVLTGVPHYFHADFITGYEDRARNDEQVLAEARALLDALDASDRLDAGAWAVCAGLSAGGGFCGRGLQAKPKEDPQIEAQLQTGVIEMPLWGVSLSRAIAEKYGSTADNPSRFLFRLEGQFPAVVSWLHSGIKAEEQELVTGGKYRVVDIRRVSPSQDEVLLTWASPVTPSETALSRRGNHAPS